MRLRSQDIEANFGFIRLRNIGRIAGDNIKASRKLAKEVGLAKIYSNLISLSIFLSQIQGLLRNVGGHNPPSGALMGQG